MSITEKPLILIANIDICRNCRGTGYLKYPAHVVQCQVCEGHGRLMVRKEIKVTLETL